MGACGQWDLVQNEWDDSFDIIINKVMKTPSIIKLSPNNWNSIFCCKTTVNVIL